MIKAAAYLLDDLLQNTCTDPHGLLGLHEGRTIRVWRPGATVCHLEVRAEIVEAEQVHEAGLFEYTAAEPVAAGDYRVYHQNGMLAHDPYAFPPAFGEMDEHLWNEGTHVHAYEVLGAREGEHQGIRGTTFAVWAPSAKGVSLVSDFNHWDGRACPMRLMGASGVWELFVPDAGEGLKYKYEIRSWDGHLRVKADPFAYWSEVRPKNASVVFDVDCYEWGDSAWMAARKEQRLTPDGDPSSRGSCRKWSDGACRDETGFVNPDEEGCVPDDHLLSMPSGLGDTYRGLNRPVSIYEVHLGSWRRAHGEFLNYRELARELAGYCLEMGFTHVELLPITEHPLDESWGYQVSGYYATTSRYGTPEDFQFFVDHLHQKGIGVIIDWVPAHFPHDTFSLANFDGTCLYEHVDPRQGYHPHWNTAIFNYGRHEVSNFLIANALFWLEKMHVDGLRVDAVASMLYLDYGREGEEWIPNVHGGKENLEAIAFIKKLNALVHENFPGAWMIAEESTAFPGMTKPVSEGGLGFDIKWNMGWMNDYLAYVLHSPVDRPQFHDRLTHVIDFAFTERFVLVLSHDEVVHEKRSLLGKMPDEPFANLRLLLSTMWCQPGKKLLFMGQELGQPTEWNCKEELPWNLLEHEQHREIQRLVKRLNRLYREHSALWELDFEPAGFEWVLSDPSISLIAYKRHSPGETLVCLHHFGPLEHPDTFVPCGSCNEVVELFHSNGVDFGGDNPVKQAEGGFKTTLTPLSTRIFAIR